MPKIVSVISAFGTTNKKTKQMQKDVILSSLAGQVQFYKESSPEQRMITLYEMNIHKMVVPRDCDSNPLFFFFLSYSVYDLPVYMIYRRKFTTLDFFCLLTFLHLVLSYQMDTKNPATCKKKLK